MAPHSSTLAWKIPWMEEPGGLQSMGSLRVRHDWATSLSLLTFMNWRRKWQLTPVFLPGKSQGQGSLVGCRLWGHTVGHNWSDLVVVVVFTCLLWEGNGSKFNSLLYMVQEYYMGWLLAGREEVQGVDDKKIKRITKTTLLKWWHLVTDGYRRKRGKSPRFWASKPKSLGDSVYQVVEWNVGISGKSAKNESCRLNYHHPSDEDWIFKNSWIICGKMIQMNWIFKNGWIICGKIIQMNLFPREEETQT